MTKACDSLVVPHTFLSGGCMTKACDSLVVPHTFLSGEMYD